MPSSRAVPITDSISVGAGLPLLLIAGPCQIESLEHCLKVGSFVKSLSEKLKIPFVFKSSYDKANRTSLKSARGLGLEAGLKVLERVRSELGVPVLTDVHTSEEVEAAATVVDILQIPAFLCRQTDLLISAGKTGKTIHVKKGQFLAPEDMTLVAEKIASSGNDKVLLCERGSCFGYRDLVVDMRGLAIMGKSGYPVIFDGTHSVQSMGGQNGASGGQREFIFPLVKAAVSIGVDGIFLECHDNPKSAPSDAATMLNLTELETVLTGALKIRAAALNM